MAITGQQIADRLKRDLFDPASMEYSEADQVDFINDAQRAIALVRPDAASVIGRIRLRPGRLQNLDNVFNEFADDPTADTARVEARRLMSLSENVVTGSSNPGRAIHGPVVRSTLEAFEVGEPADDRGVANYSYNEENPTIFRVYPAVPTTTAAPGLTFYAIGEVAIVPKPLVGNTPSDALGENLSIIDVYAPAVREWCMYMAWARDSLRSDSGANAEQRFRRFFNLLQVKTTADMAISPKIIEAALQGVGQ